MLHDEPQTLGSRNVVLLIVVALAVVVPGTIGISFTDRDEGWYAQVVREMYWTGDWLVPRYLGEPWLGKPPLLYWLVGATTAVLGFGEWQARLVPVTASVANTVLVGVLAAGMYGRRTGLWAGLVFITTGLVFATGRMLITDAVLLACVLAVTILHWRMVTDRVTHARAAGHWLAVGLGVLTKGPVILIFGGTLWLATLIVYKDRRRAWFGNFRWWVWSLLMLAVAGPWYVYIAREASDTFVGQFLWYELISRVFGKPHGHGGPPGFYLAFSVVGLLPWSACAFRSILSAVKRRKSDTDSRMLLWWLALSWGLLECFSSKPVHYILPCYLSVSVLVGVRLVEWFRHRQVWAALTKAERIMFGLVWWPMILAGAAIVAAGLLHRQTAWGPAVIVVGATFVCGFWLARQFARHRTIRSGCVAVVTTVVAVNVLAGGLLLPRVESARFSRRLAESLNALAQPGDTIVLCGYKEPTTFVYLDQPARPIHASELDELIARPDRPAVVLAITEHDMQFLEPAGTELVLPQLSDTSIAGINYVKWKPVSVRLARFEAP